MIIDFTKPYSKDNFVWLDKLELNESISKIRIEYQGMISSYKIKDRKAGLQECDITIDWMLNNITNQLMR